MVINLSISNYKSKISHKTRDYLIVLLLASTVRPVIHLFLAISPIVSCATERSICASDITEYLPLRNRSKGVYALLFPVIYWHSDLWLLAIDANFLLISHSVENVHARGVKLTR